MTNILDELKWRGLVAQTTDESALRQALADGPITAYCGFDPTAPSLHFGNLVQLVVMRHLQRAGHRIICLVGGSTGLIGDPRPSAERVLKTKEQTADWVARIQEQVRPFLDFEGDNAAIMVNNLDWTAPLSALDFLRDIGKHFRVNQMIRKDAVAARLNSRGGDLLHRVQLPDPAGAGLPAALPRLRLHAADRWAGPVGQPHGRLRPDPPRGGGVGAPADHAAHHRLRRAPSSARARATPSGCRPT